MKRGLGAEQVHQVLQRISAAHAAEGETLRRLESLTGKGLDVTEEDLVAMESAIAQGAASAAERERVVAELARKLELEGKGGGAR